MLFIASLAGLSKQETAKYGNWFSITGMVIALITIMSQACMVLVLVAMSHRWCDWCAISALKVEMTQMPELVAVLHSFVGPGGGTGRL